MYGGTISGNTAWGMHGGGACVYGTFTMYGGTISGNTAFALGGGVYINPISGVFTKYGGIIYGDNAAPGLRNTASGISSGHAVYFDTSNLYDQTLWQGDDVSLP
jgi:hypothetical protein